MVKVSGISVSELNLYNEINNKKNVDMQKCITLISKSEAESLLPKKSKITVKFELLDTNSDIANGVRRCLVDEIEVKSFDFDEYKDFTSSDPYILNDFIKKQVCLLPINQEFNYTGIIIKLEKTNKTDEIIDVLSDDFIISGKGTQSDLETIVGKNIVLCRLRPNDTVVINNITVVNGLAYKDAGKFSLVSNVTYEILGINPIIETKLGQTGQSSLVSNPTHFIIKYTTHRNIQNPLNLMVQCCDTLIKRLNAIYNDMLNIKNADTSYFSKLLTLETEGNLHKIQICNEYWTIINLICRYCYILTDSNIKFISPSLIHPEKHIGVINITHPEFSTLIQKSIKKIIAEFEIIKAAFLTQ